MKVLQLGYAACALGLAALAPVAAAEVSAAPALSQQSIQLALSPSPTPTMQALRQTPVDTHRALADTKAPARVKVCRQYLTTQCSDSRPVCIKDCRDRLVQVLALQEAQDAYIATRGLERDALGIYVDYREQEQKLTLESFPRATEWLFLSGLQLNGKLDYDFPGAHDDDPDARESSKNLKSVILAGEQVTSIEKVNFPDHVTTIKLVGTSVENLVNARFPASLAMLDASSNQIDSLACCGFPDSLKHLYLSYNALDRLENLALPPALETLAVNWNNIAIIRNVTFPATLTRLYFVENPISLISLTPDQWRVFLAATEDFVTLDGEPSVETSCVTGYFGPSKKHPFLACLLGEEPAYIENSKQDSAASVLGSGGATTASAATPAAP